MLLGKWIVLISNSFLNDSIGVVIELLLLSLKNDVHVLT